MSAGLDHCTECAALSDHFDFDPEQREAAGRWHADHPDGKITAEEQAAMAAYADEASE